MEMKIKPLPIALQAGMLKSMFPDARIVTTKDLEVSWQHTISPSPLGDQYTVKIIYHLGKAPRVFVLEPKPLALANCADRLMHVYDQHKQRLCLYYPDGTEWNASMPIAKTIVPWTYDWLFHYELWLGSNIWYGGGVHLPSNENKKEDIKTNNSN